MALTYLLIGLAVLIFLFGIRIVRPVEAGLVERLGKFKRVAHQGFHWIIPLIDKMIKVNITEMRVDIDPQTVITKDKLNALVDAVVYFKILDPKKAVYHVNDYRRSIPSLSRTTLRAIIGQMSLATANENRNKINSQMEKELDKQVTAWGIEIVRVELQKIEPPQDVQNAMNMVVKAENEKIAAKDLATATETKADGDRRAQIKQAEGHAKAIILEAHAEANAKIAIATADAEAIKLVNNSAEKHFKGNAQTLKKLQVAETSLKDSTKIVVPQGAELVNIISDAAGVTPLPRRKK